MTDRADLVAFHAAHEMVFGSNNGASYRRLARFVVGTMPRDGLFDAYGREMMLRNRV